MYLCSSVHVWLPARAHFYSSLVHELESWSCQGNLVYLDAETFVSVRCLGVCDKVKKSGRR